MKEKDFKQLLNKIQDERFVHHISELTYDRLFALWHLSPTIERQLSNILSKVIIGLFFVRYLAHVNDIVAEEADIKERPNSVDLSNKEVIEKVVAKLSQCDRFKSILENDILPTLLNITENTKTMDLADLVKLAHAGDYLSVALDDMKDLEDPEYLLWLEAVPEYYDKDLIQMGLKRKSINRGKKRVYPLTLDNLISNLDQHTPSIDAVFKDGKTISIKHRIKDRRRPLFGFIRWTKETTRRQWISSTK